MTMDVFTIVRAEGYMVQDTWQFPPLFLDPLKLEALKITRYMVFFKN